jgi:NTE family protein
MQGLLDFWGKVKKNRDIFRFNFSTLFLRSKGVFHAKPLRKLIEECVKDRQPQIPCVSCAVDLMTGEIKYGRGGEPDYVDYVVASASIPALCEPVGNLVDGGVREQSPLKKAIEDGADKLVIILCNPWRENPDPQPVGNWIQNLLRTTDIMAHEIFLNDILECAWYNQNLQPGKRRIEIEVYAPERLVIDSLDFNQAKIQPAIQYGYEQGKKGPVFKA